jgi:tetratricopeptide (TPR) repeat protein
MPASHFARFCFAFGVFSLSANAQKPPTPQTEAQISLEKEFIAATLEQVLGNTDEAISRFNSFLQKDRQNTVAMYELARLYEQKNKLDEALMRIEQAHVLDKTDLAYNDFYAHLLEKKGNYKQAADLYPPLLEAHPQKESLYWRWSYLLNKSGKPDAAIKALDRLEAKVGLKTEITRRKYQLYWSLRKEKAAEKELTALTNFYPNDTEAWEMLANFYKNTNRMDKAFGAYRELLRLEPQHTEANLELSQKLLQEGDEAAYLRSVGVLMRSEQPLEVKIRILEPLLLKAETEKKADYINTVTDLAQKFAQNQPAAYQSRWAVGRMLKLQQKKAEAYAEFAEAARLEPNRLEIWADVLRLGYELDRNKAQLKHANTVTELFPSVGIGYVYLAAAQISQKEFKKAISNTQSAAFMLASDPQMAALNSILEAVAQAGAGNLEKSQKAADNTLKIRPDFAQQLDYQIQMSRLELLKNQPQNAQKWSEKALANGGNDLPVVLNLHAEILAALNQPQAAETFRQKAKQFGD